MLLVHYQRQRFTAIARMGSKGDKGILPRALSTKWAAFIATSICHGEEVEGMFSPSVYWCVKAQV